MTRRWIVIDDVMHQPARDGMSRLVLTFPDKEVADLWSERYYMGIPHHSERLEHVDSGLVRELRSKPKEKQ